jgi:hypothetical protein
MFWSVKLCSNTPSQIFAAYVLQCIFVIISWFIFSAFKIHEIWQHSSGAEKTTARIEEPSTAVEAATPKAKEQNINAKSSQDKLRTHQSNFENFLKEFHITQCYFSTTIQVAALTYGIFSTNMLVTFMLIPLATNGVLPVVFTLVLLYKRNERLSYEVILLTTVCWILSSLVYWVLYWHVIPINGDLMTTDADYNIYRQFYYKLSALDACGGYSALAACPDRLRLGRGKIITSSFRIRALTPVIWTFSTVCLLAILVARVFHMSLAEQWDKITRRGSASQGSSSDVEMRNKPRNDADADATNRPSTANGSNAANGSRPEHTSQPSTPKKSKWRRLATMHNFAYVLVTLCFLAGAGMQMALLSIATSLDMMDRLDWGFGQVVAITIWVPPLIAYVYREGELFVENRKEKKKVGSIEHIVFAMRLTSF